MSAALTRARAAWGSGNARPGGLPAWVEALAREADLTTQAQAARRIGYSSAAVSQVLAGRYKGDLRAVERAVKGALLAETVDCPVLGTLGSDRCQQHQRAPFNTGNPLRVQLYRACRDGCPHARIFPATKEEPEG